MTDFSIDTVIRLGDVVRMDVTDPREPAWPTVIAHTQGHRVAQHEHRLATELYEGRKRRYLQLHGKYGTVVSIMPNKLWVIMPDGSHADVLPHEVTERLVTIPS